MRPTTFAAPVAPQGRNVAEASSVTGWLRSLQCRVDDETVAKLWQRYYPKLVRLTRTKLRRCPDPIEDEQDIASSVFARVQGTLTKRGWAGVDNRDHLWALLAIATRNRVRSHHRHALASKRSVRRTENMENASTIEDLGSPTAQREFMDVVNTWLRNLDHEDPSGELRKIAELKLEGLSSNQISEQLRRRKTIILQKVRFIGLCLQKLLDA